MNQLKNGTLLVVIATVIISALILMTSRDEVKKVSITENEVVSVDTKTTETNTAKVTEAVIVENENDNTVPDNNSNTDINAISSVTESVEVAAPEGPYNNESSEAPDTIQAESINAVAESTNNQHAVLNHILQPIWMDQKVGDFKSIDTGEVVFKIMPNNSDGLQGSDPEQVVTNNIDKYAATTVSADYNYQHMPMVNGGYYIAPMPQYLMTSVLPQSSTETD